MVVKMRGWEPWWNGAQRDNKDSSRGKGRAPWTCAVRGTTVRELVTTVVWWEGWGLWGKEQEVMGHLLEAGLKGKHSQMENIT